MIDSLTSLFNYTTGQQPLIHILITLLILAGGHLLVKAVKMTIRNIWLSRTEGTTKKVMKEREGKIKLLGNIMDAGVITASLIYLNTGITTQLLQGVQDYLPKLFTVLLMGVLGLTAIKIATQILRNFLHTSGAKNYIRETGLSINSVKLLVGSFKAFLYVILIQLLISQLEVGSTLINQVISASAWAIPLLVAGLIFYGFKDLFQNYAAGLYLKNSRMVRPGEEVSVDEESGKIKDISLFSTTVTTDSGYTVMTPNTKIMDRNLKFKRTESDLDTLEEISDYFVAEKKEYSAAASLEMALEMYGYRKSQEEIQEKIEEKDIEEDSDNPDEIEMIQETVPELTDHIIRSAWVEKEKISNVTDELKAWFNDGGLVVLKMNKDVAGTEDDQEGYVLATGIEDEEVLLVDTSERGVYYIHRKKLEEALDIEGGGYLVLAPEGTTSFWRIKNELIYSETRAYEEGLSKTLESRLRKIVRQGRIIENIIPGVVEDYMEKWRSEEASAVLWKPDKGDEDDQTSEDN